MKDELGRPGLSVTRRLIVVRFYSLTEWWMRLGPSQRLMIAVRDHRRYPPSFSERHPKPRTRYHHVGPFCFHLKWDDK